MTQLIRDFTETIMRGSVCLFTPVTFLMAPLVLLLTCVLTAMGILLGFFHVMVWLSQFK